MSDREHDKDSLRRLRNSPEVERALKQFQRYANPAADKAEYNARFEYAFNLSPDRRASIDALVAQGMPFLEAYDAVTNRTP